MNTGQEKITSKREIAVPKDLRPVLETIAREVIRNQPADVYAFASLVLEKLVAMRLENNGVSPIESADLYETFRKDVSVEAKNRGLSSDYEFVPVQDPYIKKESDTQNFAYKNENFVERPTVVEPKIVEANVDESATKIQAGIRGFLTRKHLQEQGLKVKHPVKDARCRSCSPKTSEAGMLSAKTSPAVYRAISHEGMPYAHHVITDPTIAASKIQAGIRGYLTRKHLEEKGVKVHHPSSSRSQTASPIILSTGEQPIFMKTVKSCNDVAGDLDPASAAIAAVYNRRMSAEITAASKIQAGVRGFLTRKQLNAKGIPVRSPQEIHAHKISPSKDVQKPSFT